MYNKLTPEEMKIMRETAAKGTTEPPRKGQALRSILLLLAALFGLVLLAWTLFRVGSNCF